MFMWQMVQVWRLTMLIIAFCASLLVISISKIFFMFQKPARISVNRLTCDNNVFLEYHDHHFSIKEQETRRTLLKGRCEGGLYPLKSSPNKEVLGVVKPSASLWHHR